MAERADLLAILKELLYECDDPDWDYSWSCGEQRELLNRAYALIGEIEGNSKSFEEQRRAGATSVITSGIKARAEERRK